MGRLAFWNGLLVLALVFSSRALAESCASPLLAVNDNLSVSSATVIGFVGGFVKHDNQAHSVVQLGERLRNAFPGGVHVQIFENHRRSAAYEDILQRLDSNHDGALSADEKKTARIIIYGHSWGGSETVTLARMLERAGIPVLMTIQVDSVSKIGQNDSVIPANVEQAVNFYQEQGLVHGRVRIRAADPARTQILGNLRFDYSESAIHCQGYPWFNRLLIKAHTQMECDPEVWNQVEAMIRGRLSPALRETAAK